MNKLPYGNNLDVLRGLPFERSDLKIYAVMMANCLLDCHRVLLALFILGMVDLSSSSAESQILSNQNDLNRKTSQGTNAQGAHCEIAFRICYGGRGSGFTFRDTSQSVEGDMWWHYKNFLILNFRNFGFRGRIYRRKIVIEDVTPKIASIDLETIFPEAYRAPREGSGEAGDLDCDGQVIGVGIDIMDSAWAAQTTLGIWRRYQEQEVHRTLQPLPAGLGETGYVQPADYPECLPSYMFARGNVTIGMPETNQIRTEPGCDDAILKAARLLDSAIKQEQNGVTVVRMPKVLFLKTLTTHH